MKKFFVDNSKQKISSANTSINSIKLPAIYKKINWNSLKKDNSSNLVVLDYGAGKYTEHIKDFLKFYSFKYFPFDPYNCTEEENQIAYTSPPSVIICSNVLNVIAEDDIISNIHSVIRKFGVPYFITIYEGDKSLCGESTKFGYQRNQTVDFYLYNQDEIIRKGVITKDIYKNYVL